MRFHAQKDTHSELMGYSLDEDLKVMLTMGLALIISETGRVNKIS